nr:unnamed protein product [Digitaria exilis]
MATGGRPVACCCAAVLLATALLLSAPDATARHAGGGSDGSHHSITGGGARVPDFSHRPQRAGHCGRSPFGSKDSPHLRSAIEGPGKWTGQPLVECTSHMCPVKINWHVEQNYKDYWRVKITITNFNFRMNYTEWNLVVQHPNFDNITRLFGLNYKPLTPYGAGINDTAMFWGVKTNDVLMQDGKLGSVQAELLLRKDSQTFTFGKGWAFPRRVYFNGDNCVMPAPENYPSLPNAPSA